MAVVNSTAEFFNRVDMICSALEAMESWTGEHAPEVNLVQCPIIRTLRESLDDFSLTNLEGI